MGNSHPGHFPHIRDASFIFVVGVSRDGNSKDPPYMSRFAAIHLTWPATSIFIFSSARFFWVQDLCHRQARSGSLRLQNYDTAWQFHSSATTAVPPDRQVARFPFHPKFEPWQSVTFINLRRAPLSEFGNCGQEPGACKTMQRSPATWLLRQIQLAAVEATQKTQWFLAHGLGHQAL